MPGPRHTETTSAAPATRHGSIEAGGAETASDDLSLADAADLLGVHYMTAYRYVRTATIPARRVSGTWRLRRDDVELFDRRRDARGSVDHNSEPGTSPTPDRRRRLVAADPADRLASRMIAGDINGSWSIVDRALLDGAAPRDVWLDLIAGALSSVGDRWEAGLISIGDEHKATAVAMHLIGRFAGRRPRRGRTRGAVIVAAAPGDRHALPTALFAEVLRDAGFDPVDLGADTPVDTLVDTARSTDRLLAVGICTTIAPNRPNRAALAAGIAEIHECTGRPVLLGGAGVRTCPSLGEDKRSGDTADAIRWLDELAPIARPGAGS